MQLPVFIVAVRKAFLQWKTLVVIWHPFYIHNFLGLQEQDYPTDYPTD